MQCLDVLLIFRLAQLCDLSLQCLSETQKQNVLQHYFYTEHNYVNVENAFFRTQCVHATHERGWLHRCYTRESKVIKWEKKGQTTKQIFTKRTKEIE